MDLHDLLIPSMLDVPNQQRWGWGTITQVNPYRVRMDGDTIALSATPTKLTGDLAVGQRVWVQLYGHRLIILGTPDADFVRPIWRAYLAATQAISNATWKGVSWTLSAETGGTDPFPSAGNSNTRTIPRDGWYRVKVKPVFAGSTAGSARHAGIWLNPTDITLPATGTLLEWGPGAPQAVHFGRVAEYRGPLLAGDKVAFAAWQDSGGNLDLIGNAGAYYSLFEIEYLRPL